MTKPTPIPWAYRPNQFDDWGWIRDANGALAAIAQDGRVWPDQFGEYRTAKTDPFETNAIFIIKAVNSHDALVAALAKTIKFYDNLIAPHREGEAKLLDELETVLAVVATSGEGNSK